MDQSVPARVGDLIRVKVAKCVPHLKGCFCDYGNNESVFATYSRLHQAQKTRVAEGAYLTGQITHEARGNKLPKVRLIPEYYAGCALIKLDGTMFGVKTRNPQVQFSYVKSIPDDVRSRLSPLEEDIICLASSLGLTGEVTVIFLGACESSSNELVYARIKGVFEQVSQVHKSLVGSSFVGCFDKRSQQAVQDLSESGSLGDVTPVRISLLSGGSCVIEKTEALWAIDVNSGVAKGPDQKRLHDKVNREALDALSEYIIAHDLRGLFALDFCGHPSQEEFDLYLREISLNLSQNHKIFVGGEVRLGTALFARGLK